MFSMRPHIIQPPDAPKPVGPTSHLVGSGSFFFCARQSQLQKMVNRSEAAVADRTGQFLKNVSAILQDQSLTCENVVKTTVFMTNLGEFGEMNAVYHEFFQQNFPARSTVQVAALPRGARVEIEVIACYPTP